jgi:hypothetical protein
MCCLFGALLRWDGAHEQYNLYWLLTHPEHQVKRRNPLKLMIQREPRARTRPGPV